jgi:hypothetical protein
MLFIGHPKLRRNSSKNTVAIVEKVTWGRRKTN